MHPSSNPPSDSTNTPSELYVYSDKGRPVGCLSRDSGADSYRVVLYPHQRNEDLLAELARVAEEFRASDRIPTVLSVPGYRISSAPPSLSEFREADLHERMIASFVHESGRMEGVTQKTYGEIEEEILSGHEEGHTGAWKIAELSAKYQLPLGPEDVLKMHSLITDEQDELGARTTEPETRGKLREFIVSKGFREMPPPTDSDFKESIDQLNKIAAGSADAEPDKILKMLAEHHVDFELMHPTWDGNGRIGRILVNYALRYQKRLPLIITKKDKADYCACFLSENPAEALGQFFIRVYERSKQYGM
jgi:hypothetical protein